MTGEPVTCVNAPSEATENTDTVLSPELAVASRPPLGLTPPTPGTPVANGEPLTGANAPSEATENTDTRRASSTGDRRSVTASSPEPGLNAAAATPPTAPNDSSTHFPLGTARDL